MKVIEFFLHIFTPRHTNNHRAKILHTSGLTFCLTLLILFQVGLSFVHSVSPQVLGYASNINVNDLLTETNSRRSAAGISALALNDQLTNAAAGKASDMFANQYWAHTSPAGKEPWVFITGAGYNYVFAGENLARDFGDSKAVVDAWMNSPSHKDNLLNSRFQDVGFAIVNGKYGDSETTLVVQMFGAKANSAPQIAEAAAAPQPSEAPTEPPSASPSATPTTAPAAPIAQITPPPSKPVSVLPAETVLPKPQFDILAVSRSVALGMTLLLVGVMALDTILIYRRRTIRLSGHNFAHITMLIVALVAITLLQRGLII